MAEQMSVYFSYVDAYRMVAVQIGGANTDLKNIIQQSGMKLNMAEMHPGEPNDDTFVKQVQCMTFFLQISVIASASSLYIFIIYCSSF